MRQQSRTSHAALDGTARRCRLHDAIATRAGQLRANLPNHFESRRHVLQNFRNVFTQMVQCFRRSPDKPFAAADTCAFRAAGAPATVACICAATGTWGGLFAQKCWPQLFPLGSPAALPAATPVARSDDPASPNSARTASAATWRSAALNARFLRRAKPVARRCERISSCCVLSCFRWEKTCSCRDRMRDFSASESSCSRSGSVRASIAATLPHFVYSMIKMHQKIAK